MHRTRPAQRTIAAGACANRKSLEHGGAAGVPGISVRISLVFTPLEYSVVTTPGAGKNLDTVRSGFLRHYRLLRVAIELRPVWHLLNADKRPNLSLSKGFGVPVWELAADNAVLAMWYTGTHNQEAIELAEAWGFTVRTMKGFTWVKLNQLAELRITKALAEGDVTDFYDFLALLNAETRMNGGNHTRANTEDVLIATRGAGLERKHAGIKQVVYSPLGAHSEKPWEVRHRLELLYGDVPRIELFSRSGAPGWSHWGNQCATASVELIPGCAIDVVKTEAA